MEYIRTKDGRLGKFYQEQSSTITCSLGCIDKENILNQADTIEELCDWKVYRPNGKIKYLVDELASLGQCFEITDYENWYGAIDIDKGLIYVAKMNDKGELELL